MALPHLGFQKELRVLEVKYNLPEFELENKLSVAESIDNIIVLTIASDLPISLQKEINILYDKCRCQ